LQNNFLKPKYNRFLRLLHAHSTEDKLLQDEVINILPLVQNVNAMAEEMQKPVAFSMMLVSPEARGLDHGRTEVSSHALLSNCEVCIAFVSEYGKSVLYT